MLGYVASRCAMATAAAEAMSESMRHAVTMTDASSITRAAVLAEAKAFLRGAGKPDNNP